MSTVETTNLKNPSSATNNIVLNADGSVGGDLATTLASKLDATAPVGKILQVVSTTKTDTFSTTSTSLVDVTGLSASITPTATTSKVLIFVSFVYGTNDINVGFNTQLLRDSTPIAQATGGSTFNGTVAAYQAATNHRDSLSANFLDSPNTASSVTYKIQIACSTSGGTAVVNAGSSDARRSIATLTVMEVGA